MPASLSRAAGAAAGTAVARALDMDARATAEGGTAPQPASRPPPERSSLVLGIGAAIGGIAHVAGNVGWMVNAPLGGAMSWILACIATRL